MPQVTVVAVTGHDAYTQGSVYAIERSFLQLREHIDIQSCLLISPTSPSYLPHFIKHIPCKPFSYLEYNVFMLYGLGQLVHTDFCLVVQNDGFVINGQNWRNEFFDYDYLGAPVPYLLEIEDGFPKTLYKETQWLAWHRSPPPHHYEPQNGGSSLRSRRLLNAPRELGLRYQIHAPDLFTQTPLALSWSVGLHHEDTFLTTSHRALLTQHGFRFAPTEVAAYFSTEHSLVQNALNIPLQNVLGGHFSSSVVLDSANTATVKRKMTNSLNELLNIPVIVAMLGAGMSLTIPDDCL